jgi:hypothetical protein
MGYNGSKTTYCSLVRKNLLLSGCKNGLLLSGSKQKTPLPNGSKTARCRVKHNGLVLSGCKGTCCSVAAKKN